MAYGREKERQRKKGHFQNSYNFTLVPPTLSSPYIFPRFFLLSTTDKWFFFLWHIVISVSLVHHTVIAARDMLGRRRSGRRRRSAVKMAAIFKCYCLRSISRTAFYPLTLSLSLSLSLCQNEEKES